MLSKTLMAVSMAGFGAAELMVIALLFGVPLVLGGIVVAVVIRACKRARSKPLPPPPLCDDSSNPPH